MKIYDISQEVLSCVVFPGDPKPVAEAILRMKDGAICNLTSFQMCAHNGTHVDAPFHFYEEGKTLEQMSLISFVGMAFVAEHQGLVTKEDALGILEKAKKYGNGCEKRILIKGNSVVTLEAAEVFAKEELLLVGNESQTVGPVDGPMAVHLVLLGKEIALLEGIRLGEVPEGAYLLHAAPLNFEGFDGAPCRATLIDLNNR